MSASSWSIAQRASEKSAYERATKGKPGGGRKIDAPLFVPGYKGKATIDSADETSVTLNVAPPIDQIGGTESERDPIVRALQSVGTDVQAVYAESKTHLVAWGEDDPRGTPGKKGQPVPDWINI